MAHYLKKTMNYLLMCLTCCVVLVLSGTFFIDLPSALATEKPSAVSRISLSEILTAAKRGNPDLMAFSAQADAAELEADTQFYLPPPMASLGSMGMGGPLASDGHMQTSYQLSQQIRFPTKVLKKQEALRQAGAAARRGLEARWLTLQTEVRKAYFDYLRAGRFQELLQQKSLVISAHARRLQAGSLSTQLMQAHLIAAQTDLEVIQDELEAAKQQETISRGELNSLMGQNAFAALPQPTEPPLSPLPPSPTQSQIDGATLNHPQIQEAQALSVAAAAEADAAKSEAFPDFTVSYRYNNNTPLAADRSNSEVMLGVSLPFAYFWQLKALNRVAAAKQIQSEGQLRAKQNGLRLQFLKRYSELSSSRNRYLRYQDTILPSAYRRLKISHGIAPTDMDTLTEHRESMERPIELEMKALDLRTEFEKSLAEYESLLGTEVTPSRSGGPS